MAQLLARLEASEGYVYVRSIDGFPTPEDARSILRSHGGQYSDETKEWRVPDTVRAHVVAALRMSHTVVIADAASPRAALTSLECRNCAAPYSARSLPLPESTCTRCGSALELVPPHVCTSDCRAHAVERSA